MRNTIKLLLVAIVAAIGTEISAQLPQPVGSWSDRGAASLSRSGSASVSLPDGRTLVLGGVDADGNATATVIAYDAIANSATSVGQLLSPRAGHSATVLNDGRVVVIGGRHDEPTIDDIEIFDPSSGTSQLAGHLSEPRTDLGSALLPDGTVLIVGGTNAAGEALSSAEIFEPASANTTPVSSSMQQARSGASATTLIDGRVLVVGGRNGSQDLQSAEIFDPFTGAFTLTDTLLSVARSNHTAILLQHNAGVLIVGGTSNGLPQVASDLFLPAQFPDPFSWGTGTFTATGGLNVPRSSAFGGATNGEGYAFVASGGAANAEVYRFATVKTDRDDYAPGERAVITGTGWQPGEAVKLLFQEDPAVHADYVIDRDSDGNPLIVADENGNIFWDQWAPEPHDLNVRFYLLATGSRSRAQTTFTDASDDNTTVTVSCSPSSVPSGSPTTCTATVANVASPVTAGWPQGSVAWSLTGGMTGSFSASSCALTQIGATNSSRCSVTFTPSGSTSGKVKGDYNPSPSNWKNGNDQFDVTVTAGKVDPTVTSAIHDSSHSTVATVALGSTVHDSASVSGSAGTPTGTVDFTFYTSGNCTLGGIAAGTITLNGSGIAEPSDTTSALAAGSYSFKAHYNGNGSYNAKDSGCESLTVNKGTLAISTTLKFTSPLTLGSTAQDSATVTGIVSGFNPTNAIVFRFYSGGNCTTGVESAGGGGGTVTFAAPSRDSGTTAALAAGNYAFSASIAGDDNYNPTTATSTCEPFTVNKGTLAISTTLKFTSPLSLGSTAQDSATVTGMVSGFNPTNAIVFTFYSGGDCTTGTASAGGGGGTVTFAAPSRDSDTTAALAPGNYAFSASIAGDDNYNPTTATSTCEPFTVNKGTLAISTTLKFTSPLSLGSTAQDSATVTGMVSGFNPTNAIVFKFYSGGNCTTGVESAGGGGGTVTFAAPSRDSGTTAALAAGNYAFSASIAGDDNYNPTTATSTCEPFTVNKGTLAISTTLKFTSPLSLGSTAQDSATVTGMVSGFDPTYPIVFTLYSGGDCTTGTTSAGGGGGTVTFAAPSRDSGTTGALAPGNYAFRASIAGDDNYNPTTATSECEPFTVNKGTLAISTTLKFASPLSLGSTAQDSATVTGMVSGFDPTYPIVFTLYSGGDCTTGTTSAGGGGGTVTFAAPSRDSGTTGALAAGNYAFRASIAGDANYNPASATSECEPFTVNAAITTTLASVPTTTPQYSDKVKLHAEVTPHQDTSGTFQLTGKMYFYVGNAAVTCPLAEPLVGFTGVGSDPIAAADDGVAEIEYQLTSAAGAKVLTACFYSSTGNFTNSGDTENFTENKEDATFANVAIGFGGSIPVSQTFFTVTFDVKELRTGGVEPDINAGALPGNIGLVNSINAKIVGISTNSQYTGSCTTGTGGSADYSSARSFSCDFNNLGTPFTVDAYTLTLDIPTTNDYWTATFEDALSVWDPNAGFATGGGTILLDGDRVSFGFSYTAGKNLRSGFVVVRHLAGGGVCRVKSNNQMNAPAVNGNTVTLSGKGNYSCTDALGVTTASQGNITISAYAEDNATSGIGFDKFWVSNAAAVTTNYLKMTATAGANAALLTGGNVQVPQPQKK